jgi:DNA-binding NarL/FixJ family response regulator
MASSAFTTILLIDHSYKDRTYYADRIKTGLPDSRVLEATDGYSGLELYKAHHVDCIVSELYLPDMSGFELLLEVAQPNIPVIILSDVALNTLAIMAKAYRAHAFVAKNTSTDLVLTIRRAIARVRFIEKQRPSLAHAGERAHNPWSHATESEGHRLAP